jgi:hypothetical protein
MTQGNDGLRYIIDRRGGRYFGPSPTSSELHQGDRGYTDKVGGHLRQICIGGRLS